MTLLPGPGQFVALPVVKVLDPRSGIGAPSAAPLARNATLTLNVTGGDADETARLRHGSAGTPHCGVCELCRDRGDGSGQLRRAGGGGRGYTVLRASGAPLANGTVYLYTADPPDPALTTWVPTQLGTAATDANGNWSFTLPEYASLPADAQAAANYGAGQINVQAVASGTATAGGTQYLEGATSAPTWPA